ncbi:MAG: cellulase family glycosylhydrolase [Bacteroidales bacterium]|jgi:endoglucanase|nr:cellulase family glycosylhydrolase [Bacteroidales bacterium]
MKQLFLILAFTPLLMFTSCGGSGSQTSQKDSDSSCVEKPAFISNPSGFEIYRGINISHWISQTGDWVDRETFFTEEDVKNIKSYGFDHIRLPVDEEVVFTKNGEPIDSAFDAFHNAIRWCLKHDMRVVFDLHILRSHHFNARNNEGEMTLWTSPEAQEKFLTLWDTLSANLKQYPNDMLAYEFMNEPVAPESEMWNDLVKKVFERIRALEPNRVLMLGSNRWQQPHTFPDLYVPKNDPNIILTVHTYHPYFITHYQASWSDAKYYTGPVNYPGVIIDDESYEKYVDTSRVGLVSRIEEERAREHFDIDKLREIMKPAVKKARESGLQLYCNEFGCLPNVERETRLRYYNDITTVFKENNIVFAAWDYKGNFGIVGWDSEKRENTFVDKELIEILTAY